jgi:Replication-relaxation
MNLPKLTTKQKEILKLLYRHRFLNRIQIQNLMGHKDYKTINLWLKDLREKEYVTWIYSTDFAEKTKPAIYYIGINGVRFLKTLENSDGTEYLYLPEEVPKRYRESSRSRTFIDRCLLLADCCIAMQQKSAGSTNNVSYSYETEADYLDPDSDYHFLVESELAHPQLVFLKEEQKTKGIITKNFLLEVFDATMPRYRIKKRLTNYVKYLELNHPHPLPH